VKKYSFQLPFQLTDTICISIIDLNYSYRNIPLLPSHWRNHGDSFGGSTSTPLVFRAPILCILRYLKNFLAKMHQNMAYADVTVKFCIFWWGGGRFPSIHIMGMGNYTAPPPFQAPPHNRFHYKPLALPLITFSSSDSS